jgi:hypothetical protein
MELYSKELTPGIPIGPGLPLKPVNPKKQFLAICSKSLNIKLVREIIKCHILVFFD